MKKFSPVGLVFGLVLLGSFGGVQAEDKYPSRPIELVVPFNPGGSADVAARCYSDDLAKILNVPVNVVNRAGGTGIQGTTYVINSKKDGYTLLGSTDTPLLIMPVINKEVTFDPLKDVTPIGLFASVYSIFAVRSDSPFKTLQELIDYARTQPGQVKERGRGTGHGGPFQPRSPLLQGKNQNRIDPIQERRRNSSCAARRSCGYVLKQRCESGPAYKGRKAPGVGYFFPEASPGFSRYPYDRGIGLP